MNRLLGGLLFLALLVSLGAGLAGRLNDLLPLDVPTSAIAQRAVAVAPARLIAAVDQDTTAAIQQVIQRSNEEQAQAIAARDPSLMSDTVTSDHFQDLAQTNQDLLDHGVISIKLVKLEWGAVAVNGSSATATTYETWTTTLSDGTVDQSRDRNDYGLVLDAGAWKIKTNDHPDSAQAGGRPNPSASSPPPQTQPFPFPDNQNTSHNWSGYAATGGNFTSVTGTWTVPQHSPWTAGRAAPAAAPEIHAPHKRAAPPGWLPGFSNWRTWPATLPQTAPPPSSAQNYRAGSASALALGPVKPP